MLTKVISGGQTGVDQAALRAAQHCDIPTGGTAAKGWQTEKGPATWLVMYRLVECKSPGYPARTRANIEDAHATLILTESLPLKGGTLLTFDHAYRVGAVRGAGLYVADIREPLFGESCREWLVECMGKGTTLGGMPGFILNVAGPRESKSPGIGDRAEEFLRKLFEATGHLVGRTT